MAKKVGDCKLAVNLAKDGIKDSPFAVKVTPAAPNAANTEAHGDGISKADTDAPAKFKVQTKDAFGNNCVTGGAPIKVVASGPNNETVNGNVKDNEESRMASTTSTSRRVFSGGHARRRADQGRAVQGDR